MLVEQGIQIAKSITGGKALGTVPWLSFAQAVIDEVYAQPSTQYFEDGGFVVTESGTLLYPFATFFGDDEPKIRHLKGLYKPDLTSLPVTSTDYGRRRIPRGTDQRFPLTRTYASHREVKVDNLLREVRFASDPGDTTDVWKFDYYRAAPALALSSHLPLLAGWERRIFVPGLLSFYELQQNKKPGPFAAQFMEEMNKYRDALELDAGKSQHDSEAGYLRSHTVERQ